MHIPHSALTSFPRGPLLFVFGERVKYFVCLFVSYERSYRNVENKIFRIRAVLVLGFSRFARLSFEDGFVSIRLERIFVSSRFQYYRSSVTAVSSRWSSKSDSCLSSSGDRSIASLSGLDAYRDFIIKTHTILLNAKCLMPALFVRSMLDA